MTWLDLTVADPDALRDYYAAMCGWTVEPVSMGDYDDYALKDAAGESVGGICHARGDNTGIPPVWIPYFTVPDVEAAVARAVALGGELLRPIAGGAAYLRDPAGVVSALYQAPAAVT